jgi:TM2 domain-containing membrane protein YozV
MAMPKILQALSAHIGIPLTSEHTCLYTIKDGFPVQFFVAANRNVSSLYGIIRLDETTDTHLVENIFAKDVNISQTGLKPKKISVEKGMITLKWVKGILGYPKPERIRDQFMAVLNSVKPILKAPGMQCRTCGSKDVGGPLLINGLVDCSCPACLENLKKKADHAHKQYEAMPTNFFLSVIVASVVAILGAALWAGIIIGSHRMYWMIAVLIGATIGWCTIKSAGKGGMPVQTIAFAATFISVLLGMIFYVGYSIQQDANANGKIVDWYLFARQLPYLLMQTKENILFSLGGGIVGAIVAASKAAKPNFGIKIEK